MRGAVIRRDFATSTGSYRLAGLRPGRYVVRFTDCRAPGREDGRPRFVIAFKFDAARITHLPLPRPLFEIFLHSPRVEMIEVMSKGVVRKARLFYLRDLKGKAARVADEKDR